MIGRIRNLSIGVAKAYAAQQTAAPSFWHYQPGRVPNDQGL
jgi:hypothetical protein